ncbi:MAG: ATP-binding cassette domain-containing protein [Microlunatus sp.]
MSDESVIKVRNLSKEFRRPRRFEGRLGGLRTLATRQYDVVSAVEDVSFDIEPGELVGYLGPNGAGKSTTIKMLTGIMVPTSGTVEVGGLAPWRDRERNARQIGVVFGQRSQLWWDLPVTESFRLVKELYEVPTAMFDANLAMFTDLLGLGEFLSTPVRQLSLGQRMRADLAAAMLYEPAVLYLDEPTIGLDVLAKEAIRTFLAELNRQRRTTVILTTHDLDDLERLASRLILIDHGRVVYDGDLATLKTRYAPYREVVVQPADPTQADRLSVLGAEPARVEDGKVWLRFNPDERSAAEVISAVLADYQVSDLSIIDPDLEGVLRQIYAAGDASGPGTA